MGPSSPLPSNLNSHDATLQLTGTSSLSIPAIPFRVITYLTQKSFFPLFSSYPTPQETPTSMRWLSMMLHEAPLYDHTVDEVDERCALNHARATM